MVSAEDARVVLGHVDVSVERAGPATTAAGFAAATLTWRLVELVIAALRR